ncbi:hypothetical protein RMSM_06039 [Rhodopirellula maiorica SM1]|uniref:PEP-CTERM protein-sorting domain-containing protein n=1 Tax=Rhodopirellula maiorica SM1 TaxID=1265738 RepID=M5RCD3_9BACT|nr:hypothetical protein RMSM_06039 [Rhodopirellula maiorica SM1]
MTQAHAGVMTTAPAPDIEILGVGAIYDAGSDQFFAFGSATRFKSLSGIDAILPDKHSLERAAAIDPYAAAIKTGVFEMQATIKPGGEVAAFKPDGTVATNTFTIHGSLNDAAPTDEIVLLKGTITEMNMAVFSTSGVLEFMATGVSGELSKYYGGAFAEAFLKMTLSVVEPNPVTAGAYRFESSFMAAGQADVAKPVPEPASMAIWGSVVVVGSVLSRRRMKNRLSV